MSILPNSLFRRTNAITQAIICGNFASLHASENGSKGCHMHEVCTLESNADNSPGLNGSARIRHLGATNCACFQPSGCTQFR